MESPEMPDPTTIMSHLLALSWLAVDGVSMGFFAIKILPLYATIELHGVDRKFLLKVDLVEGTCPKTCFAPWALRLCSVGPI